MDRWSVDAWIGGWVARWMGRWLIGGRVDRWKVERVYGE